MYSVCDCRLLGFVMHWTGSLEFLRLVLKCDLESRRSARSGGLLWLRLRRYQRHRSLHRMYILLAQPIQLLRRQRYLQFELLRRRNVQHLRRRHLRLRATSVNAKTSRSCVHPPSARMYWTHGVFDGTGGQRLRWNTSRASCIRCTNKARK